MIERFCINKDVINIKILTQLHFITSHYAIFFYEKNKFAQFFNIQNSILIFKLKKKEF